MLIIGFLVSGMVTNPAEAPPINAMAVENFMTDVLKNKNALPE